MRPEIVNILGVIYSIQYVERPTSVGTSDQATVLGHIDHIQRDIRILAGQSPSAEFEVLLHEVIHAIATSLAIDALDSGNNEENIQRLSVALADTLVRNNWVKLDAN